MQMTRGASIQRKGPSKRGTDVKATRGNYAKNKNQLGSDHDRRMSAKVGARQDEFGSEHNRDDRKKAQIERGRPKGGAQNPAFRESAQDERAPTGKQRDSEYVKKETRRRQKSHGSAKQGISKAAVPMSLAKYCPK